jgi:alpha-L-fucosidase 2
MNATRTVIACFVVIFTLAFAGFVSLAKSAKGEEQPPLSVRVGWADFLDRQDLLMDRLAKDYYEAPFVGNGLLGAMLWQEDGNRLHLEIGRTDVTDHRVEPAELEAITRKGRLPIGHFTFSTLGKITGGTMRVRLYDAEAVGKIRTDRGEIEWRLLAHTRLPLIAMEVTAKGGEKGTWQWKPAVSVVPRKPSADRTNPPPKIYEQDGVRFCLQKRACDGSDYCTAWQEVPAESGVRRLLVTVADDWPKSGSEATAAAAVAAGREADFAKLLAEHRAWWHAYYPASFVSIPDARMEAFYWIQMYKFGSSIRKGGPPCDVIGPWYKPTIWPAYWFNLNAQMLFWTFPGANRLEMMENLSDAIKKNEANLILAVPEKYRHDSAGISRCTGADFAERFDRWNEYGNLTWLCHNLWLQHRYSMDDEFLRERVYPLLRRAVNLYLHVLTKDARGRYHTPRALCPESFTSPDNNYDLSSVRWGCETLLKICARLKIEDELIPKWKDVLENLVEFPTDKNGYSCGPGVPASKEHRHWTHLLMFYPYYTVNWDQPEQRELLLRSWRYWADPKMPNAWSQAIMSSMASSMGRPEDALLHLQAALDSRNVAANTMHTEGGNPCFETHSGMCQMLLDMLLQSWGERIRVFPAVPKQWPDVVFHDLRTEGAFLVSAARKSGETRWVRMKSLAGEPCRVEPGMDAANMKLLVNGKPTKWKSLADGVYELPLSKGDAALLFTGNRPPELLVEPLPRKAEERNPYRLKLQK